MSKKKEEPEKILLGRPGNNLKMGIVGMPNVGKSTLFNILTKMNVPAENFPFCTIDPNLSRVVVPDERFDFLVKVHKPKSEVPAVLSVTDIAGLVRGASEGQGLGNAFLSHISAVDGIYQVVRIFEDSDVTHVEGALDPIRDLDIITDELLLKDEEHLTKRVESLAKVAARADRTKQQELEFMQRLLESVKAKKLVRFGDWTAKEVEFINPLCLLTAKPVVYLVNMSVPDYLKKKSKWLPRIKQWIDEHGGEPLLPFSAALEADLLDKSPDDIKAAYPDGAVSAIPRIIKAGYSCLQLVNFFTAGEDEVRAWTIRKGTKAPEAAGVIHTDFMNGFICAEVMAFNDFREHPSEAECKAAGKYRQQGKAYVVEDGDIMFFKANTGGGLSKKK